MAIFHSSKHGRPAGPEGAPNAPAATPVRPESEQTFLFGDLSADNGQAAAETAPQAAAAEEDFFASRGWTQPETDNNKKNGRSKKALIGVGTALAGTAAVGAALFGLKAGDGKAPAKAPAAAGSPSPSGVGGLAPSAGPSAPETPGSPERLLRPAVIQTEQGPLEFTTPAMESLITYGEPGQPLSLAAAKHWADAYTSLTTNIDFFVTENPATIKNDYKAAKPIMDDVTVDNEKIFYANARPLMSPNSYDYSLNNSKRSVWDKSIKDGLFLRHAADIAGATANGAIYFGSPDKANIVNKFENVKITGDTQATYTVYTEYWGPLSGKDYIRDQWTVTFKAYPATDSQGRTTQAWMMDKLKTNILDASPGFLEKLGLTTPQP